MIIRAEEQDDAAPIRRVVRAAFAGAEHSSGTEERIVDGLRNAGSLTISLVAVESGDVVGHVAISPVAIDGATGWYGLGPVAVFPPHQRAGIGSRLVQEALSRLRREGAEGCVVLGDPAFYGKFGFAPDPQITYPGVPKEYFQAFCFGTSRARGQVQYHSAFDA